MTWSAGNYHEANVPAAQISGTTHSDFVVPLTRDNLPADMFDPSGTPCRLDGGDIQVAADAGGVTRYALEVVGGSITLDSSTGAGDGSAEIHVLVPTLAQNAGAGATFFVRWSGGSESQPAPDAPFGSESVWADYAGAWHFNEGAATSFADSSANGHTLTTGAAATVDNGPLGSGVDLQSSIDTNVGNVDNADAHTLMALIKQPSLSANAILFGLRASSGNHYSWISVGSAGGGYPVSATHRAGSGGSSLSDNSGASLSADSYVLTHSAVNNSVRSLECFVDGASNGASTSSAHTPNTLARIIVPSTAAVDEARIRNAVDSPDRVATEHRAITTPGAFVTLVGSTQTIGGGHALAANDAEAQAEIDTGALSQTHGLGGDDAEAQGEVDTGALSQAHALGGDDAEAVADPDTGAVSSVATLAGDDAEAQSEIDTGALSQAHVLGGDDAEAIAEPDDGALTQAGALQGDDVEAQAEIDTGALSQSHQLGGDDVEAVADPDSGAVGGSAALAGDDAEAQAEIDAGALGQTHTLGGDDAEAVGDADTGAVAQSGGLVGDDAEAQGEIDTGALGQSHVLGGDDAEAVGEIPAVAIPVPGIGFVTNSSLLDIGVTSELLAVGVVARSALDVTPTRQLINPRNY